MSYVGPAERNKKPSLAARGLGLVENKWRVMSGGCRMEDGSFRLDKKARQRQRASHGKCSTAGDDAQRWDPLCTVLLGPTCDVAY